MLMLFLCRQQRVAHSGAAPQANQNREIETWYWLIVSQISVIRGVRAVHGSTRVKHHDTYFRI